MRETAESWLLHPSLVWVALGLGLSLCVYLFVSVKQQVQILDQRWKRKYEPLETSLQEFQSVIEGLRRAMESAAERAEAAALSTAPRPGMNLTRRSQVLRMSRRGERPEQIAAALSVPQNEVDLLLKVHQVTHFSG